jgi:hypothetical protein
LYKIDFLQRQAIEAIDDLANQVVGERRGKKQEKMLLLGQAAELFKREWPKSKGVKVHPKRKGPLPPVKTIIIIGPVACSR